MGCAWHNFTTWATDMLRKVLREVTARNGVLGEVLRLSSLFFVQGQGALSRALPRAPPVSPRTEHFGELGALAIPQERPPHSEVELMLWGT